MKTKKTNKKIEENYKAVLIVLGKKYESSGETISEAISNIKVGNCKGKSVLTIMRGSNKKDRVIMPAITYRIFNSQGLSRDIAIKNISTLFQGI